MRKPVAVPEERALGAGSATEVVGGAGVVVLAILGLAGLFPMHLLAISCIAAGGALLLAGSAESSRARTLTGKRRAEVGGGLGVELVGAIGAVVLGILALIGIAPMTLASIAAIALGAALLFSSVVPANERLFGSSERTAVRAGEGAAAVQGFVGVGAICLGILALIGVASHTLALVALLAVGTGMMLTGSALFAGVTFAESHA